MTEPVLIYTTFPDTDTAKHIIGTLLKNRLIACGNILGRGTSFYRWEQNVKEDEEIYALLKTTEHRYKSTEQSLISLHPYECPCIIKIPVSDGNPAFLEWIRQETR